MVFRYFGEILETSSSFRHNERNMDTSTHPRPKGQSKQEVANGESARKKGAIVLSAHLEAYPYYKCKLCIIIESTEN